MSSIFTAVTRISSSDPGQLNLMTTGQQGKGQTLNITIPQIFNECQMEDWKAHAVRYTTADSMVHYGNIRCQDEKKLSIIDKGGCWTGICRGWWVGGGEHVQGDILDYGCRHAEYGQLWSVGDDETLAAGLMILRWLCHQHVSGPIYKVRNMLHSLITVS